MMKHFLHGICAATVVAALAAPIPARAAEMSCDVPFAFEVNGQTLPAGNYRLSTLHSALVVRGLSAGGAVLTNALRSREEVDVKLVFHKYGTRHILREAWMGGRSGRAVPESSLERELKVRAASGPQRVSVPAS